MHSTTRTNLIFYAILVIVSTLQGVIAIHNFAFVGQDFSFHIRAILSFEKGYNFSSFDPPGLSFLGHITRLYFSKENFLGAISIVLLLMNTISLLFWFALLERVIINENIRRSAALVLTFLPVRVVHSVVIANDGMGYPFFIVLVALGGLLIGVVRSTKSEIFIALCISTFLGIALTIKYTFLGFLPIFVFLYFLRILSAEKKRKRILIIATGIALIIPGAIMGYEGYLNYSTNGELTHLKGDSESRISRAATISLYRRDLDLLEGLEFVCREPMTSSIGHGYLGLVHMASFSDPWSFFKGPPKTFFDGSTGAQSFFSRARTLTERRLTYYSISGSLPLTICALIGCAALVFKLFFRSGLKVLPPELISLSFLSAGFFFPIFFGITHFSNGYSFGYWTPRLILPSLLGAIVVGYFFLDQCIIEKHENYSRLILAYTFALSLIYIALLNPFPNSHSSWKIPIETFLNLF